MWMVWSTVLYSAQQLKKLTIIHVSIGYSNVFMLPKLQAWGDDVRMSSVNWKQHQFVSIGMAGDWLWASTGGARKHNKIHYIAETYGQTINKSATVMQTHNLAVTKCVWRFIPITAAQYLTMREENQRIHTKWHTQFARRQTTSRSK